MRGEIEVRQNQAGAGNHRAAGILDRAGHAAAGGGPGNRGETRKKCGEENEACGARLAEIKRFPLLRLISDVRTMPGFRLAFIWSLL